MQSETSAFVPGSVPARDVNRFKKLGRLSEGSYGTVYKAQDKDTEEVVALKRIHVDPKEERDGFPIVPIREIRALFSLQHPNIVELKEIAVSPASQKVFMVLEHSDFDLRYLMEHMKHTTKFTVPQHKCIMKQLLQGIDHCHSQFIMHRDLKPTNILFKSGVLKICDFGLARPFSKITERHPMQRPLTAPVVTLWYRPLEVLLGDRFYSSSVDMWSIGCIMAEVISHAPLFAASREIQQIDRILSLLGTPNETVWPGYNNLPYVKTWCFKAYPLGWDRLRTLIGPAMLSDTGFDLLCRLLTYDPRVRITAKQALSHPWFEEAPIACAPELLVSVPPREVRSFDIE
eukprot:ANDGO_06297.mRNA.1 Cyclin-dependent kinase G1